MRDGVAIFFIRHGQTDWNAAARYQGQRDIPLNDVGRAQARRNGEVMRTLLGQAPGYDFVASPLGRAQETMQILRETMGLPRQGYRLDDRLKEVHYGAWEGRLASDLPRDDPAGIAERRLDPYHWRPRGGESYADLMARTTQWLDSVVRDTIAVSHGGVSRTLRGRVLGIAPADLLHLDVPQDRVLVLRRGQIEWL
jgi:probable phosphoglycerate mutase